MKKSRSIILQTAFEGIHKNGYHQLRIDKELSKLGITKGAFYHYFKSKEALLLAVIEEILGPKFIKPWKQIDPKHGNILRQVQKVLQQHIDQSSLSEVKYGCIFNNLVHELCADNQIIRKVLSQYFNEVHEHLEKTISYSLEHKEIKPLLSSKQLSLLILSIYHGGNSINKLYQTSNPYTETIKSIILLLESINNEKFK